MKNFGKKILTAVSAVALCALMPSQSQAQITVVPENDNFSLKLIGRTNFDFGSFLNEKADGSKPDNGVAVNDTRLGVSGKFLDKWDYKVELCFAYNSNAKATTISFRDVFVKYNFNKTHHIQFGNVFMGYGMKPLGLAYKFIDDATVDNTFCSSRKMGIVYLMTTDPFNFNGGVYSDGNIDNGNSKFDQGVNLSAKAIYRPIINETTVLHFGAATLYTNSPNTTTFSGVVPENFTTNGRTTFKGRTFGKEAGVDADGNVIYIGKHYSRYEGEMIFIHKKFMLEAHYQGASYEPTGSDDRYHVGGALAQCSFLLIGEQQNYNKVTGLCQNASPRNLELLARYDYLDLHDGGRQEDVTVGINYFFSKHFNMKLNYVYTDTKGNVNKCFNSVQMRAQFSF
ncbi:MAG: porin [Bacteroidales bacterium]|nr:porin [Bacteroidales bacterium]